MGIFDGLLVVSLEQAVAAPYCSCRLADGGARVIKIERETGDFARNYDQLVNGESAYFLWLNRGKESLTLDIKSDQDNALLHNIIAKADIFIQNLAPGAAARSGFSSKALNEAFPRLITVDISGYGEDGPYQNMKAYDLLVQAESGLCSLTGTKEAEGRVGVSVCDIAAGMNAYEAVLEALLERHQTGLGRCVEVSLFDAMADWMNVPYLQYRYGGVKPKRAGLAHPTIAPYGVYVCGDDIRLLISIQNEREWKVFCEKILEDETITHHPDFHDVSARVKNRPILEAMISKYFASNNSAYMIDKLETNSIAFGRMNDVESLLSHPQLRTTFMPQGDGGIEIISPAPRHAAQATSFKPAPSIGQHNDLIKAEFL